VPFFIVWKSFFPGQVLSSLPPLQGVKDSPTMEYDLIVLGCGAVGSAAGYYAHRAGLQVLMIDSHFPPHQSGSHHGETRLMRLAYGEGAHYVPLLLRASQLWAELAEQLATPLFQRSGVLHMAPAGADFLAEITHSAQQYNLAITPFTAQQIREKWPVIALPDSYQGLLETDAGYLYSEKAIAGYIQLAREAGCAQLFNCPVSTIRFLDKGVELETADGIYRSKKLAVTSGSAITHLLPQLPVTPVRKTFAWHQADGRYSEQNHFPAFTLQTAQGAQFYGFPASNDSIKLGKHDGGQPMDQHLPRIPFGACSEDGSELFPLLRHFLPGVGVCLHGSACSYDMSPDGHFIIDTLAQSADTLVISGLSGHGFKFASVLGEIIANFAAGETEHFDLSAFSLSRFS